MASEQYYSLPKHYVLTQSGALLPACRLWSPPVIVFANLSGTSAEIGFEAIGLVHELLAAKNLSQ
jgi:hypothetical protein